MYHIVYSVAEPGVDDFWVQSNFMAEVCRGLSNIWPSVSGTLYHTEDTKTNNSFDILYMSFPA